MKLPANPPKSFQKLASSPTFEGILKQIAKFYGGEEKNLAATGENRWTIHNKADNRQLSTRVIQTKRGFYFGSF